jgi:hypothetical protein
MKYMVVLISLVIGTAIAGHADAKSHSQRYLYLNREFQRIRLEGVRIKGEADLMRVEGTRLNGQAKNLRTGAAHLDSSWVKANRSNPEKYIDYPGRNRSQRIMLTDADRQDQDADALRVEGTRLDGEAERLSKLAAAVNAQAQQDLIKRMMGCCKKADMDSLRTEIFRIARALGTNYVPSQP